VVALAHIAGDAKMISSAIDPDPQFALTKDDKKVRLLYSPDCDIPEVNRDTRFLLAKVKTRGWKEFGKTEAQAREEIRRLCIENPKTMIESFDGLVELTPCYFDDLVTKPDGSFVHPRHDLHWEMAEAINGKPRELLSKDLHRDGLGKVANFQIPYGSSDSGLERQVEAVTGKRPEPGTGASMKKAYASRNPVASEFLSQLEQTVTLTGHYRAVSGRIRHFKTYSDSHSGYVGTRAKEAVENPQKREARNFPMQNNVADTMALAAVLLLKEFRARGMKARTVAVLYDAMLTLCPIEEKDEVARLHHECIHERVAWNVPGGRRLRYTTDTNFCRRWSTTPTKEEKAKLGKPPKFKELDRVS
jgi:hypothetical protein